MVGFLASGFERFSLFLPVFVTLLEWGGKTEQGGTEDEREAKEAQPIVQGQGCPGSIEEGGDDSRIGQSF